MASGRESILGDLPVAASHKKSSPKAKETFSYAIGHSSLGAVVVASSEQGLVSVLTGENASRLVARLQARFPKAEWDRNGQKAAFALPRVIKFIEKPSGVFGLPLDIRGTVFQRRVWRAVMKIPHGATSTYSDIALQIGAPKAMRAVGSSCTNNHFSIIIPCHRVLRKSASPAAGLAKASQRQRHFITRESKNKKIKS